MQQKTITVDDILRNVGWETICLIKKKRQKADTTIN